MKKHTRNILISLGALVAMPGGCAVMVPGHLYPVQGPLSKQSVPPVYTASLNGGVLPHGTITVKTAPGVACPGDWKAVSQKDPSGRQMAAEWDAVYGNGYFVANVLGQRTYARATLTCSNGTKLNLEFLVVKPGDPSSIVGVVTDEAGNLFKLSF